MTTLEAILLIFGGVTAGVINTMAGGGSMLTVPLLILAGVPADAANGSNRVGILTSNMSAAATFRRLGVEGLKFARYAIIPAVPGSIIGAYLISQVSADDFQTGFGLLMLPLIALTIWKPKPKEGGPSWSTATTAVVFFGIGLYAGAVQAGFGLVTLAALSRAGFDLVTANMVKVVVNVAVTFVALIVFILEGNVRWIPALILAIGLTIGGWLGARLSVKGGEKWIRIVMVVAALALAGRLLGLWG